MPSILQWYAGNRLPALDETLTVGGVAHDLTGKTVKLKMRLVGSPTLKVDAAATIVTPPGTDGRVAYSWAAVDVDTAGTYLVWWEVTTTAGGRTQDMGEALVQILAHSEAQNYVGLEEFKTTLTLAAETFADADITIALSAASRGIDEACGRRFYADADAAQVRYYSPHRSDYVQVDDLVTVTSLKTDPGGDGTFEETWTLNTDYTREPLNAVADGEPWTLLRAHPTGSFYFPSGYPRSVELTGKFGWNAVPSAIRQATTISAHRLLKRAREVPFGIAGIGLDGSAIRIVSSDPDVQALIAPFSRAVLVA